MVTNRTLWVEKDSYHTAIIVSHSQIEMHYPGFLSDVLGALSEKSFVRFGWGDREYYGASHKNVFKMLKALLLPTRAVMEVSGFAVIEEAGDWVVALDNSNISHTRLLQEIESYFYLDERRKAELVRKESNGCFYYRAKGIYFLFSNCNNWTAKMLKKAGLKIHFWYAFLSPLVMKQLTFNDVEKKKQK